MARLRKRQRGTIERRGNSLRVKVYVGTDPLTGKRLYLRESTTDEREAERILTKLLAQVDANTHAKTEGTIGAGLDEWLPTHDVDESTRETNETYIRLYIKPALGGQTYKSVTPRVLERFYAELARCAIAVTAHHESITGLTNRTSAEWSSIVIRQEGHRQVVGATTTARRQGAR